MQLSDWSDLLICIRQNKKHQPWSEKINAANSSELLRFNWIFNTQHIHTDPVCEALKLVIRDHKHGKTWWSRAHFKGATDLFSYRLLNNLTYSCNHSRCLLLAMRQNAGLKHFCTDWTFQTLKLCCPRRSSFFLSWWELTQPHKNPAHSL